MVQQKWLYKQRKVAVAAWPITIGDEKKGKKSASVLPDLKIVFCFSLTEIILRIFYLLLFQNKNRHGFGAMGT
jgi:uncharacterized protein YdeI (YjbR/CyaY-like superfamily)